jgi:hypothetical protein
VNLVFDHVVKFQHMHHADTGAFVEWLTGQAVVELDAAIASETSFLELFGNCFIFDAIEARCRYLVS